MDEFIQWREWKAVEKTGQGQFGTVYKIERDVSGKKETAALKHIHIPQNPADIAEMRSDGYDDESIVATLHDQKESIVGEYNMMQELCGAPNVVICHDIACLQCNGGFGWDIYIIMELLKPLWDELQQKPISEETTIKVARDICNALVLCREHNIIHRDIKPQNIFVSRFGDFKLGDFGIARTVEKTLGHTLAGTYKYMAPEVKKDQPYGHQADIYSLGLVLYWMLNRRRLPFMPLPPTKLTAGMDEHARNRRFSGEKLPPPVDGSDELKRIVLKACAYDPEDRYCTADKMLKDLKNLDPVLDSSTNDATENNQEKPLIEEDEPVEGGTIGKHPLNPIKMPEPEPQEEDPTIGKRSILKKEEKNEQKNSSPPPEKRKSKFAIWVAAAAVFVGLIVGVSLLPHDKSTNDIQQPNSNEQPTQTQAQLEETDRVDEPHNNVPKEKLGLVGISLPTKELQRWSQDGDKMKKELEATGYEVDLRFAANDPPMQVSQIEDMIANGAKALVVASIDSDALGTVLEQVKEAGCAIIAYDRPIGSDSVSYYVTFSNFSIGAAQGQFIVDTLDLANAGDKTFNLELIGGSPIDGNAFVFYDGAMSVLKPYIDAGTLVVVSGQVEFEAIATEGWSSEKAQERFENLLSTYYADKQLDAVMCSNDSTAQGVAVALKKKYKNNVYPILTGQDCDIASVKNMLNDKQAMSIFKDTRTLAAKTVEMVDAIMKGAEPPTNATFTTFDGAHTYPAFYCDSILCTKDLVRSLLVDSGYYTAKELGLN